MRGGFARGWRDADTRLTGCPACGVGLLVQVVGLKSSLRERVEELTACADRMYGEVEALAAARDATDSKHEAECANLVAELLLSQNDAAVLKVKVETMEVERQEEREREKEMASRSSGSRNSADKNPKLNSQANFTTGARICYRTYEFAQFPKYAAVLKENYFSSRGRRQKT